MLYSRSPLEVPLSSTAEITLLEPDPDNAGEGKEKMFARAACVPTFLSSNLSLPQADSGETHRAITGGNRWMALPKPLFCRT